MRSTSYRCLCAPDRDKMLQHGSHSLYYDIRFQQPCHVVQGEGAVLSAVQQSDPVVEPAREKLNLSVQVISSLDQVCTSTHMLRTLMCSCSC